ncbi:MAG: ComEC/Rec2 family competence protein, partial [Bacteroidales bacterium]
ARLIHHRTHPVHTIMVAAFLMIVVMPGRLREVGFQLSYCAVLGIVILFPLFRDLPNGRIRNRYLRWIWEATAVSLAAQVTTAPLVIFYFRQYPVYGLVTNLVAIPLMGGLIALFVVSVPFFYLGWFPMLWNRMLILPAKGLNLLMELVAGIPGALVPVTGTDRVILLCWIGILLLAMITLQGRLRLPRYAIMFLLMVLTGYASMQQWKRKHSGELMVAHFFNGTLLMIREGPWVDCYRWNADSAMIRTMERYISEVWGGRGTRIRWMDKEEGGEIAGKISSWQWLAPELGIVGNDRIRGWLIDGTPSMEQLMLIERHPGTLVLLSGEPSLPAAWLHDLPVGCQVVFDGTCRSRYLERITEEHPLIHTTFRRGAYRTTW